MSDREVEQLQQLSDQEAAGAGRLTVRAQAATWTMWAGFTAWYEEDAVAELAARTTRIAQTARVDAGNLGAIYMRQVLTALHATRVPRFRLDLPDARLGADLSVVYSRPAEAFRAAYAVTEDLDEAAQAAQTRLDTLIRDDLLIARRDGERQQMEDAGVDTYRRIVHPERSETGVCGLCLAASDRVYHVKELLPVHDECQCTVAPDGDAAAEAVAIDLDRIYRDAGGTTDGRALKRVRYQVNEHGELGPVLGVQGQRFQRKGDAPKGDPIERARRELAALEPVLESLERREAAGEDVAGPLTYQIARVTKLRAIAA